MPVIGAVPCTIGGAVAFGCPVRFELTVSYRNLGHFAAIGANPWHRGVRGGGVARANAGWGLVQRTGRPGTWGRRTGPLGGWPMRRKTKTAAVAFCALLVMAGAPQSTSWSWKDAQESTIDKRQPDTEAGTSSGRLYNVVFAA